MDIPRVILVATDFSSNADHTVRYAAHLACALRARCIIAHVYRAPLLSLREGSAVTAGDILLQIELEARTKLEQTRQAYRAILPELEWRLVHGDPRDALLQLASAEGADLLVVGTRGLGGVARLVLGSVAAYIVRHATCAVLAVPAPAHSDVTAS